MSATVRTRSRLAVPPAILINVGAARERARIAEEVQPVANSETAPVIGHNSDNEAFKLKLSEYWVANTVANKAKRDAEIAKKSLNDWMIGNNITSDSEFVDMPNGARVKVAASISETDEEYMDVEKLHKLVDDAQFMSIISATKTAVTAIAGTNIMIQATATRTKPASLSIKELK